MVADTSIPITTATGLIIGREDFPPAKKSDSSKFCSIVMLTYRKGLHDRDSISRKSIASLLEATTFPYELILMDNTQNNRGFSKGRNIGASRAGGDYVAFIDDDIILLPGWLEECIRLIEIGDKFMATPVVQRMVGRWELPQVNGIRQNYRTGSNCMVMRKSAFLDVGMFAEFPRNIAYEVGKAGKHYADRIAKKGYTFLICDPARAIDLGTNKHSYA